MSLLSSLLSFSCLNQSQQSRSNSLGARFLFEQISPTHKNYSPTKNASKSLTKLNFLSTNLSKIDPRSRCLHRLAYRLNTKIRKHYYSLFVVLEAMKKKDIKIAKERNEESQNRELGAKKIGEIINLLVTKNYERVQKQYSFSLIKQIGKWKIPVRMVVKIVDKYSLRRSFERMKEEYQRMLKMKLKIEIFSQVCQDLLKNGQIVEGQKIGFESIKRFAQADAFSETDSKFTTPKTKINLNLELQTTSEILFSPLSSFQINSALQINQLHQLVHIQAIENYQPMTKFYQWNAQLCQKPLIFEEKSEHFPQISNKLMPQELGSQQIGDLQDNSSLFRHFSKSNSFKSISGIQQATMSQIETQSLLNCSNMMNERRDIHYHENNFNIIDEKSKCKKAPRMNTIKTSDSLFGVDAVTFKNSLVMERQSITNQMIPFYKKNSQKINHGNEERFLRKKMIQQIGVIGQSIPIRQEQIYEKQFSQLQEKVGIKSASVHTEPIKPKSYSFNCRNKPIEISLQTKIEQKFKQIQQQQMKIPLTQRKKPIHSPINHHSTIIYGSRQPSEDILPVRDISSLEQTRERRVSYPTNILSKQRKFISIVQK